MRSRFMTPYRRRMSPGTVFLMILLIVVLLSVFLFCFVEYRLMPLVCAGAKSKARQRATEVIAAAVDCALTESDLPLVVLTDGTDGITSVQTNVRAIAALRASAVDFITGTLADEGTMTFTVPLGNLAGSQLAAGHGFPVKIRLVPVSDVIADVHTEFVESGINQTLHKIVLRIRVTVNMLTAAECMTLELSNDICVAETVIVGKVPDAYTAINRFELDEQEENDLNDYAATLP